MITARARIWQIRACARESCRSRDCYYAETFYFFLRLAFFPRSPHLRPFSEILFLRWLFRKAKEEGRDKDVRSLGSFFFREFIKVNADNIQVYIREFQGRVLIERLMRGDFGYLELEGAEQIGRSFVRFYIDYVRKY